MTHLCSEHDGCYYDPLDTLEVKQKWLTPYCISNYISIAQEAKKTKNLIMLLPVTGRKVILRSCHYHIRPAAWKLTTAW